MPLSQGWGPTFLYLHQLILGAVKTLQGWHRPRPCSLGEGVVKWYWNGSHTGEEVALAAGCIVRGESQAIVRPLPDPATCGASSSKV